MQREAAVVISVGRDEQNRVWCTLDHTIFRPGSKGRVGPYDLIDLQMDDTGQPKHFLKSNADPCVGELLALEVADDSSRSTGTKRKQVIADCAI